MTIFFKYLRPVLLPVVLLVMAQTAFAIDERYAATPLRGNQVRQDSSCLVRDDVYFDPLLKPVQTTHTVRNLITFKIDEFANLVIPDVFEVQIQFKVYYKYASGASTIDDSTALLGLTIKYDKNNPYGFKAIQTFLGGYEANVVIKQVNVLQGTLAQFEDVLMVENEILVTREYDFDCTENAVTAINKSTTHVSTKGELLVSWSPERAADEYDLEWTWVDSAAQANFKTLGEFDPKKIFTRNATRVSITGEQYFIPLLYDGKGFLFYRVRAVQVKHTGQRMESSWSSDFEDGFGSYEFTGHENGLNWQASTSFAEEGKRKSVVQYFDGSLRNRQSVTKDNSTDSTIVAETMYDFQGRPVIQVLPSPSLSSIIKYTPNFNKAINGVNYTKELYDGDWEDSCYCTTGAPGMDSLYGASNYYSPANPRAGSAPHTYIPDAEKFPFTEVRYTADNTGRITLQSGVGRRFQIANNEPGDYNHSTKYIYGAADQEELDALFGTEVGNYTHYFKNMVRDPNGQYSVSYVDMHGRTIATALAGKPRADLDTLVSNRTQVIVKKLLDSNTNLVKGTSIESSKGLIVTKAGEHTFHYSLMPDSVNIEDCGEVDICYDCVYDLEITITDECNNTTLPGDSAMIIRRSNFSIDTNCNANVEFPSVDTAVFLEEGIYLITKKLTVSKQAMDFYRDSIFMRRNTCVSLDSLIREQKLLFQETMQCEHTCADCEELTDDFMEFYEQWLTEMGYPPGAFDNFDHIHEAEIAFNEMVKHCENLCQESPEISMVERMMIDDMTAPFGQYANPDAPNPHSIFRDARYKNFTWLDNTQNEIWIHLPGRTSSVRPSDLEPQELVDNWQEGWGEALLPLHPEYCRYQRARQLNNDHEYSNWENEFLKIKTFDEAVVKGWLNPGNFTIRPGAAIFTAPASTDDRDKIFYHTSFISPGLKAEMNDSLAEKKIGPNPQDTISLWSLATIMAHCPEGDNSCFDTYRPANMAFNIPDSCSGDLDIAWRYFQQLYLQERREIVYKYLLLSTNPLCNFYPPLDQEEFHVHFPDPNDITGPPQSEGSGQDSLGDFIQDNCYSYVKLWWEELKPCGYNDTDTAIIFPRLRQVCMEGGDENHVLGSSTAKPSSTYTYRSFEEVLKDYDAEKYNALCNAFLISAPVPYDQQPVYSDKPIYQKPDSCECGKINTYYTQYEQYGQADTSFGAFLYRITGVRIYDGVLDTLRMVCNNEIDCRFLKQSLVLPVILQCASENACVNCTQVENLYKEYLQEFTDDAKPAYEDTDSMQILHNRLFRNYMNQRLGFALSHTDYLTFMDSCDIPLDSADLFEPLDTATVTCKQLQALVDEFYYQYFTPLSRMQDLHMTTFAGNKTPLQGPKGVFDVNGQLIGNTVDGSVGAVDTSFATIWNSSVVNKVVGQITPLGNGEFRLNLNPGQQVPCNGLNGMRYYEFNVHTDDTMRFIFTGLGSYVDFGDGTSFKMDQPLSNSHTLADKRTLLTGFAVNSVSVGSDFVAPTHSAITHFYPDSASPVTYGVTLYHTDTLGYVGFQDHQPAGAPSMFSNLRGYFPHHSTHLIFRGTRDSTFNRSREVRNWSEITSLLSVQMHFNDGTDAPFIQNNFGSLENNHGLRHLRLDVWHELIPNWQVPGVVDNVAGNVMSVVFPNFDVNFPDARWVWLAHFKKRESDYLNFSFTHERLKLLSLGDTLPTGYVDTVYNQIARSTTVTVGITNFGPPAPGAASSTARTDLINAGWYLNHDGLTMGGPPPPPPDLRAVDTSLSYHHPFTAFANERLGINLTWRELRLYYQQKCGASPDFCGRAPDSPRLCGKTEPAFPFVTLNQRSSCDDSTLFAMSVATLRWEAYRDSLLNVFNERYLAKCLNARYAESFTVEQPTSEYHYTLYYYDQAGNLVKTVSPQGVDMSKFDWLQDWVDSVKIARAEKEWLAPDHGLKTDYRYNTLNQVVAQKSPDGGLSEFWYDRLGRLAISRNAFQKAVGSINDNNRLYSYTRYDHLGRITEVGQVSNTSANGAMTDVISRDSAALRTWLQALSARAGQITNTVYDEAYSGWSGSPDQRLIVQQRNLRNRVSFISITDTSTTGAFSHAMFYTYDILGNVDTLLQDYGISGTVPNMMNANNNRWKKITYKYDLISGKVNMVMYQRGWNDQFFHRYTYDAENRLTLAETSLDSLVWERDARYEYYRHGPLARTTLGEQLVQGVDYAYTLQGWLKGINSTGGAIAADAGSDGVSGGLNQFTARDALGLTLNYFEGDYRNLRAPAINPFPDYTSGMDIESPYRPLFNGNISSMSLYNRKFEAGVAGGPLVFNNYKYDQLNRLTRMDVYATSDFYTNGWDNMSIPGTKPMEERVSYDANGNILGYIRNGITATPIGMDTLEYRYYPGTNQLMQIGDKVPADRYGSNSWEVILDIDSQAHVKNYIYDEIGNLISDSAEQIRSIKWSVYGKILEIRRDATDKVPITFIRYTYDALGNRISKVFNLGSDTLYTWYVRDAQGNMLSIYTSQINVPHTPSDLNISQGERYIYGSSRVGVYNLGSSVDGGPGSTEFYNTNTFYRGWKQYELSNHLGNVLVTLSDKKFGVSSMGSLTHYEPDMTSGNDYYPFGMLSRIATSSVGNYYRHGFNGKEFDWEAKGWQNQVDYGMRIYDPRIGRFLSVDPLTADYADLTPYQYASNRPIDGIDLDGLEFTPARINGPNGIARESTAMLKYSEPPHIAAARMAKAAQKRFLPNDPSRKSWTQKWRDSDNMLARLSYDIANGLYTLPQQLTASVRNDDYITNIGGNAHKSHGIEGEKQRLDNFVSGSTVLVPGAPATKIEGFIAKYADNIVTNIEKQVTQQVSLTALESKIVNEANQILGAKEFGAIKEAFKKGVYTEVEIGGRKIAFEPGISASGFTFFDDMIYIGKEAFTKSPQELGKTILHELYRNATQSATINKIGAGVDNAKPFATGAKEFAEKAYQFLNQ